MPVYILRAGAAPIVKIGWARNAVQRVKNLQTGHHERLRIIRLIDGPRSIEHWMQEHFADRCITGEWFRFCREMLTVAPDGAVPAEARPPMSPAKVKMLATKRAKKAGTYVPPAEKPRKTREEISAIHKATSLRNWAIRRANGTDTWTAAKAVAAERRRSSAECIA